MNVVAVDREARRLFDELRACQERRRSCSFVTSDDRFRRAVLARLSELLRGDVAPVSSLNADD